MASRLDTHVERLKARRFAWPIPWASVEDIARWEDCRTAAYRCPAGTPTIAWGETENIRLDMQWTEDQCDARFFQQIVRYTRKVEALLDKEANANQLGALVSLSYNIGLGALARSTVLRKHNEGDFEAAGRAFGLWNKAKNPTTGTLEPMGGLTARRAAETALYLQPAGDMPTVRMPQAVEAESSLTKSPINIGGAVTAVTGTAAGASAINEHLGSANSFLTSVKGFAANVAEVVGLPPGLLVALILVGAGLTIMHWRRKQRDGGWV